MLQWSGSWDHCERPLGTRKPPLWGQKGCLGVQLGPVQDRGPSATSLPAQLCSHARDRELIPGPVARRSSLSRPNELCPVTIPRTRPVPGPLPPGTALEPPSSQSGPDFQARPFLRGPHSPALPVPQPGQEGRDPRSVLHSLGGWRESSGLTPTDR